ncbi:MAG: hypothetical protein M3340_04110 [Actinomycetota bacterium]|nr:hypothetical protein [Actinomycetota bacterium]
MATVDTPIPILLDRHATQAEVEEVAAVFKRAGFRPKVRPVWEKKPQTGNGPFWVVLVLLGISFKAFADGFFGRYGENAADALREFVRELREARRLSTHADDGWIMVDDGDDTEVMLAGDLPEEAYHALFDLDWPSYTGGMLIWDEDTREWYDPNRRYAIEPDE